MYQLGQISQLLRLELEVVKVVNQFLLRGCEPVSVYVLVAANYLLICQILKLEVVYKPVSVYGSPIARMPYIL